MLPPIPSWDGLHPVIVHFPIALLLVAPILILLGTLLPRRSRPMLVAALILMAIGTTAAWIAVSTGEAAGELAERMTTAEAVVENHEELAETTSAIFTALTAVFAVIVLAPAAFKKELAPKILIPLNLAFLLFYGAGAVVLINTAHEGGRLVHEFGVRAAVGGATAQNNTGRTRPDGAAKRTGDDDDD
jgi:uncharacterized membrane protein